MKKPKANNTEILYERETQRGRPTASENGEKANIKVGALLTKTEKKELDIYLEEHYKDISISKVLKKIILNHIRN
jgi:hypothetical protein